jgi:opacity protein-like surface antigen
MKKIYSLFVVAILGSTTMFAQGLGASLDYAMWNGAMIEDSENTGSTILSVNYTHNLSEKIDLVGSVGYGMGFDVVPMKVDLNYGITDKISANLGMGLYMISDSTYDANAIGVTDEASTDAIEGSTNEFGINLGLSYQITSAISLGFNYNMIKSGDYDFNGMQFGLSYAFGVKSTDKKPKAENNNK